MAREIPLAFEAKKREKDGVKFVCVIPTKLSSALIGCFVFLILISHYRPKYVVAAIKTLAFHCLLTLFSSFHRLYTEEYFLKEMPTEGIPEMQRSNLVSCVIQVCKSLGFLILLFLLVFLIYFV